MSSSSDWEVVIGLEVHVQLHTRAKVFASSSWGFGQEPNEKVDPVVLGLPGTLPVVNREAVEKSILFGLVVGAEIPARCAWDRKNYFYPDNPKNYQLTQKDFPVVIGGSVEIELPGPSRNVMGEHKHVRIHHAHLEEDVGKLSHAGSGSLVDYNRAGVPLLEIVTEPDLRSSAEAEAFLRALVAMLTQAGVADCDMEKGQLRCDCNVSIRHPGAPLGTRTETKNLNSISSVRDTVIFETARQIRELEAGRTITQETRGWNADLGRGYVLRDKEDAHDYRYFPDPDIPTLELSRATVERLAKQVPENSSTVSVVTWTRWGYRSRLLRCSLPTASWPNGLNYPSLLTQPTHRASPTSSLTTYSATFPLPVQRQASTRPRRLQSPFLPVQSSPPNSPAW